MSTELTDPPRTDESAPARHRAAIAAISERALRDDFDSLLSHITEAAAEALEADVCVVLEPMLDGRSMRLRAAYGADFPAQVDFGAVTGRALLDGGAISLNDPLLARDVPAWLLERRLSSAISQPIGERGFGALCAFRAGAQFDLGDVDFLRGAANLAALAARPLCETPGRAARAPELIAGFLATTSHEIRNPLHVILGYNEIIADHLRGASDSLVPLVDAVERAGHRLLDTIERLLAYARLESGTVKTRSADVALASVIEAAVREFAPRAAAKGLGFSAGIDEPALTAHCDPDHLMIALRNLADNAVKFTELGEIAVRLYREPNGGPAIQLRDTGVGIDSAYVPRLFEPFAQEQSSYSRKFEGSGLGLALASRYLRLNGAALSVESKKGVGSTFTIHLPEGKLASR
ncbi:MAG TPA: HAMP domain-containing sensor histidine kinase [Candidatus Binataceae bacterium]|nr:HAMP domain-containing sensor histidine kinase [Candidatus Binataceae bacterium]